MGKKIKKEVEPPPKDVFDPLTIESKKAATVVLMLNSTEEEILAKACEAIYKFALKGEENKTTLLELGAVEPLTKLLTHEDKIVRRNATMVFGILASNNDVKKSLRELDILNAIIAQLAPEEEVVIHEFASLCLANMSVEYTSKVQIFEYGGLEPLIRLLGSPDPDVKKNSIECIYNLVQDFHCRMAIQDLSAIPPILDLLKSEYPIIQLLALKTLGTITNDRESRVMLRDSQGLEQLLKILETKEFNDLHIEALAVLANCLEDLDTMQQLQQAGGLRKLLAFAENTTFPDIQKNATKAIARAAYDPETRKILHEQGVEKCLINLLGAENDGTKVAAAEVISAMSENLATKEFFNTQGIPQIVQLLKSENDDVKEGASLALANLTTANQTNAIAAAEAGAIESLINTLSCNRDNAIANAATVLTNMATQEALRLAIQNFDIMRALIHPLNSSNTLVQSKAALTVAALACDAEARIELRHAGGLEPLVELLHSNNDEVRRHASWAVMVCASDEPTSIELCKIGVLDVLEEINQSMRRKNNFSEAAYNRLLNNNLSLKYCQTGYLSSNNMIPDGFYDAGRMSPGTKLLSLKEFALQEPNDRRAIILINSKPYSAYPTYTTEEKFSDSVSGRSSSLQRRGRTSAGVGSPTDEKADVPGQTVAVGSKTALKERASRKGKGKKEEEKNKEEEEAAALAKIVESSADKEWCLPSDNDFCNYITEVSKTILPITDLKAQIEALANFVAGKMGGPISKKLLHEFKWELHISEVKFQLKSNIIPIGYIKKGTFYHRALLFKALADKIGIGATLVRGEYNRAWNEVKLVEESYKGVTGLLPRPEEFIIDLMFEPGALLKTRSQEAEFYKFL
ncbi:armadillo repeat-containing protein 3 isoform X2 [Antechinus flavipes]|uniref:armadillo repeat-containing protein 3 isoform X2 n=1 Tax=Antechinus flavipes TaxID=38775 RepID=UPI002235BC32|nr:armadillo repeat-containing protein 3 isoform X2 [Antechinus flavipes]